MGLPGDDIVECRIDSGQFLHRSDAPLDPLAGTDEAPGEHRPVVGVTDGRHGDPLRHPVRNDRNLGLVDAIVLREQSPRSLGHHDDGTGLLGDALEHATLTGGRGGQHGVQHDDRGRGEPGEHLQHLVAVGTAVDPVLVLHDDGIARTEGPRGIADALGIAGMQFADDHGTRPDEHRRRAGEVVHHADDVGPDVAGADHGGREGRGERRETATCGRIGAEETETGQKGAAFARSGAEKAPGMRDVCRLAPLVEWRFVEAIRSAAVASGRCDCVVSLSWPPGRRPGR